MEMKIRNIEIGERIGESSKFRVYLGNLDDGKRVILKIAKTFEDNDILAAEASKFTILRSFSSHVETLSKSYDLGNYQYDFLFANLCASFMEPTKGYRRINVFAPSGITLDKLTPLIKLQTAAEIDARTSVWILGRFLKFYNIFEQVASINKISVVNYPLFSPGDYFIGPKEHRLIYYNFSEGIDDVFAFDFVKAIAKFILSWVVIQDESPEQEYLELLKDFSETGRKTFMEAHKEFYDLVKKLWGIHYYPFTYRMRNSNIWKNIQEE